MKVTITGGTSFIGTHLIRRLIADGYEITVLARDPDKVPGLRTIDQVRFVQGTLTSREAIREALSQSDALVHVALGWGDTGASMARADTLPAIDLFEAAADLGVAQLLYTSSIAVFDTTPMRFTDEIAAKPARYYGATKAANEAYLMATAGERGLKANVIRPGYTFGNPAFEGAPIQSMPELPDIVRSAARGEDITVVRNSGLQFIWADDLARVFAAVLSSDVDREYFTALSPEFITWEEIATWAIDLADASSRLVVTDRGVTPAAMSYDVSAIKDRFNLAFDARTPLRSHLEYLLHRGD
jgi:UDP-glucose 4-epimerase